MPGSSDDDSHSRRPPLSHTPPNHPLNHTHDAAAGAVPSPASERARTGDLDLAPRSPLSAVAALADADGDDDHDRLRATSLLSPHAVRRHHKIQSGAKSFSRAIAERRRRAPTIAAKVDGDNDD